MAKVTLCDKDDCMEVATMKMDYLDVNWAGFGFDACSFKHLTKQHEELSKSMENVDGLDTELPQ